MTWLKGTTTFGALAADLTKLIVGEMADGDGVTCAAANRWIRDPLSTVPDAIRSPVATDTGEITGVNRAGFWAATGFLSGAATIGGPTSTLRQVNAQTTQLGTSRRIVVGVRITLVNTIAGNYSTVGINFNANDLDTGISVQTNSGVSVTAAGRMTLLGGIQVDISNPSGFVVLNESCVRAFDFVDFKCGIDMVPLLHRRSGAVTYPTPPPGVQGTDWSLTEHVTNPTVGSMPNAPSFSGSNTRGQYAMGIGIRTTAGLTGALYSVSFTCARHRMRLYAGTSPYLSCDMGRTAADLVSPTVMRTTGMRMTQWHRPFATAASVLSTSLLQYFLSVTGDGVVMVLNGDPGASGRLAVNYLGSIIPHSATSNIDLFPTITSHTHADYSTDVISQHHIMSGMYLWHQRRLFDDAAAVGRDWQLGACRADIMDRPGSGQVSGDSPSSIGASASPMHSTAFSSMASNTGNFSISREEKPSADGTWHLYLPSWIDGDPASANQDPVRGARGYTDRFAYCPGDGWGSGDVLTDTVTGEKWLMIMPDYSYVVGRTRTSANVFHGGVAVRQV